ncbi:hypothetical protein BGZ81_000320 [Podila clonocystis]|nr:hypothetical protein BGZ81_000320 [Podila clonocystis]
MLRATTTLEDADVTVRVGLAKSAFVFEDTYRRNKNNSDSKGAPPRLPGAQEDDEKYGRGGYTTTLLIPTGSEFTVEICKNGTKTNGLIQGCQGGCEKELWSLGFDQGFQALASVKVEKPEVGRCSMVINPLSPDPSSSSDYVQIAKNEILRVCNGRCANFLYGTTMDLSKRTDPPGYRTLVALLSNWTAWVSCSMYDALDEWVSRKGDCYAWADTLHTSKIYFIDADFHVVGRPHEVGLLNKGHGWDDEGSPGWVETCKKYGLRGTYMRQNVGMLMLMYEIGMYGRGPLAWSCMALDTKFFVDYNLAADNSPCNSWWDHIDKLSRQAIFNVTASSDSQPPPLSSLSSSSDDDDKKYVASYALGCSFAYGAIQVKQRCEQDIGKSTTMRRGGVVWEDRELWTSFLVVDGALSQMMNMTGGCVDDLGGCAMVRVINDVVDLGYDWGSGEVCNSILTITQGKTDRESLSRAYVKVAAVLNRMSIMRPDIVGSVGVLTVQAWQMCNSRHRIMACALVSNDPGLGPTEVSATWHEAFIQDLDPTKKINQETKSGELFGRKVKLTVRSWNMISRDTTGAVAKMLYHGHVWLVDRRRECKVPTGQEIAENEDVLRILLVTMAMEFERADFIEALWCWMIESWCASDMMWHAMVGSTTLSSEGRIGSDRLDDKQWTKTG